MLVALLLLFSASAHSQEPQPKEPKPKEAGTRFEWQLPPSNSNYPLTPDSLPKPGVPKGVEIKLHLDDSKIFPDTRHVVLIYVPAAYKPEKAACVFVFLDNIKFEASTVFDNLIAAHQMPVTIAIGISPGVVDPAEGSDNRQDRSFEFDNRSDRLSRYILEEVLPAVEQQKTPDGRAIHLSHNADDRAIGGASTGGIGAFNVAWQRPDAFHRVFTTVGTFVGMRGGEQMYVQVRKTEPKPLRVFLTDGANDGWTGGLEMGDWFMANLTMNRALEYAGYDVHHLWGQGAHNAEFANQVFPEAVRWLFRDYSAPITAKPPNSQALKPMLIDGQGWQLVSSSCAGISALASDAAGHVRFSSQPTTAEPTCSPASQRTAAFAAGPDGTVYTVPPNSHTLAVYAKNAAQATTQDMGFEITALAVRPNGDLYLASKSTTTEGADLWLVHAGSKPMKLAQTPHPVSALAFLPDGEWLYAAQPASHLSYSFRVLAGGRLDAGEPFYDVYTPADADGSGTRSVVFDRDGLAYLATTLGVQIGDRGGRISGILPLPENAAATSLAFGGDGMHTLFVLAGTKLYTRKLQTTGFYPAAKAITLSKAGPG